MSELKRNVIILTATITPPPGATNLSRTDPRLRLNDYRKALDFYLHFLKDRKIDGVIFAENSASDISDFQLLSDQYGVADRTEFISFYGLDYPPEYGRGYGEFKLIDHVMQHSKVIQELSADENIWKVTGRYIIRNLQDILKTCPSDADIYCHCRNIPLRWTDLYVLLWNKNGYETLLKNILPLLRQDAINESAEQAFRNKIDERNLNCKIVKRFRKIPELEGVRGLDNKNYTDMKLKIFLRKLANTLAPWLWI